MLMNTDLQVNVGLRAYVWNKKDRQQRVARELWNINGATYHAFRQYTVHVKEAGFPEQNAGNTAVPAAACDDATLSTRPSLAKGVREFNFGGMKHIFDQGMARTTCLRFGHASSELLAWAAIDGTVRIATLAEPPRILKELHMHKRPVPDIDWSPDNLLLASVAEDGGVCLWHVDSGQLMRTFMLGSAATCCRFLTSNANFLVVGTSLGQLHILNTSTALTQECVKLSARGPHKDAGGVCAMGAHGDLIFVASTTGTVLVYRCVTKQGKLQPLQALFRTPPPPAKQAKGHEAANLVYTSYACLTQGPALLVSQANCHLLVYRLVEGTGALELVRKAPVPIAARKIKATFCPTDDVTEPELIAMGGENTGVFVYDLSHPGPDQSPLVVSQLQGHMAPVVDISWSADDMLLASCDCDGVVIVWRRQKPQKAL